VSDSKPVELSAASCRPLVAAATAARLLPLSTGAALEAYRGATSRLLLLDYDGTLGPFADRPHEAIPPITLLRVLEKLAASPAQRVAVVSGRPRPELEAWFGAVPGLWLAAEHGAFLRDPVSRRWARSEASLPAPATAGLRFLLDAAVEAAPGSFVEEKEYGLVWHHRLAKDGAAVSAALAARLEERLPGTGLCAVPGHSSVERAARHDRQG
jgi:trehalose 6-phosphate synthase/phosphatase